MTKTSFKLAHLSDLHLDYRTGRIINENGINVREQDAYDALDEMITDIIDNNVDIAIIAGDIFHSPKPTVRAIVKAQESLQRLASAGVRVYSLAGNHDASDIRADVAASRVIHLPDKGIFSHVEPYVKYEVADGIHLHLVSHHMYSEQTGTMSEVNPVEGDINIFSTHGSVIDSITKMRLSTDQSPREIIIPDFVLNQKDWSYRLLGHIHERSFVGSTDSLSDTSGAKTYYNGSLIRRGFSDGVTELGRGWTLWSIDESGNFTPEFKQVKQRPQYDFASIDCSQLTSSDISELIVDNLKTTQGHQLPLLRQTLMNISPSKHASLDWSTINKNSNHALTWRLKIERDDPKKNIEEDNSLNADVDVQAELINNDRDLLEIYDEWEQHSEVINGLDDTVKDRAIKRARKYIKTSREKLLGEEES